MVAFPQQPLIKLPKARKAGAKLLAFVAAILRWRAKRRGEADSQRIVILEPYGMGDLISLQPLIRGLLQGQKEVTVCARPAWHELLVGNVRTINSQLTWADYDDRRKYGIKRLFGAETWETLRGLRANRQGFTAIDPRGDVRSIVLLWLAGCGRVLSLERYLGGDSLVPVNAAELIPISPQQRRWEVSAGFLEALDLPVALRAPDFSSYLHVKQSETGSRRIGIIAVAPWRGKWWEPIKWQLLIQRLKEAGHKVVALGGPNEEAALATQVGEGVEIEICSSIAAWMKILSELQAVIALDTGPMHLADALGKPLVALYGASTLPLWAPSGEKSIVLHRQGDVDAVPVHPVAAGVARGRELMARHTPDEVFAAVKSVL